MATEPGPIVSVDQLESPTPGVIAQLKGTLTKQHYKYATVFMDQFSRLLSYTPSFPYILHIYLLVPGGT